MMYAGFSTDNRPIMQIVISRISRDFNDEYPKLRIFSHPNVMPVIGCCNSPPNLVVISQYVQIGKAIF